MARSRRRSIAATVVDPPTAVDDQEVRGRCDGAPRRSRWGGDPFRALARYERATTARQILSAVFAELG